MHKWNRKSTIKSKAERFKMAVCCRPFWLTSTMLINAADVSLCVAQVFPSQDPMPGLPGKTCGEKLRDCSLSVFAVAGSYIHPVCHAQLSGLAVLKKWAAHKTIPWFACFGQCCCQLLTRLWKQIFRPLHVPWNWISAKNPNAWKPAREMWMRSSDTSF